MSAYDRDVVVTTAEPYTRERYQELLSMCDAWHDDTMGTACFIGPDIPEDEWKAPQCRRAHWKVILNECPLLVGYE